MDSESKRGTWGGEFVAARIMQVHRLLEASKEIWDSKNLQQNRLCKEAEALYNLVNECIEKEQHENQLAGVSGTNGSGGKTKKVLVQQLQPNKKLNGGTMKAPQFDPEFVSAVKVGEKVPFNFNCPLCHHKNCYPVQSAAEVEAMNKRILKHNKKNKAEAKRTSKSFRSKRQCHSNTLVCVLPPTAALDSIAGAATSATKRRRLELRTRRFRTQPSDPNGQICSCEVCALLCFFFTKSFSLSSLLTPFSF